jgi:hypothetical protein
VILVATLVELFDEVPEHYRALLLQLGRLRVRRR